MLYMLYPKHYQRHRRPMIVEQARCPIRHATTGVVGSYLCAKDDDSRSDSEERKCHERRASRTCANIKRCMFELCLVCYDGLPASVLIHHTLAVEQDAVYRKERVIAQGPQKQRAARLSYCTSTIAQRMALSAIANRYDLKRRDRHRSTSRTGHTYRTSRLERDTWLRRDRGIIDATEAVYLLSISKEQEEQAVSTAEAGDGLWMLLNGHQRLCVRLDVNTLYASISIANTGIIVHMCTLFEPIPYVLCE